MQHLQPVFTALLTVLFLLFTKSVYSQVIPVGSLQDEQLRIQMLLSDSLSYSSVNRPFSGNMYRKVFENNLSARGWWNRSLLGSEVEVAEGFELSVQAPFLQTTINSRFPVGENNQAAWYGRGTNTEFMAGLALTSEYLTVNFHPHIVYQENRDFLQPRFIFRDSNGDIRYVAEDIEARLDAPFRFGPDPFTTFDWGNSSIRLHYNQFETGLSTEPLWWGPANRYPLIMSNNAPGFGHFFIGTREALNIPYVGSFHFKWLMGYPQESEYYDGSGAGNTRFTNAANVALSPQFLPNLTLGLNRVYHLYEDDGFRMKNIWVIFDPFRQSSLIENVGSQENRQARNQTASFYVHLHLPEANAEIYAEYFREDHSWDFRDFINQPHHNSAYMFGFQKLIFAPFVDFYKVNLELTNLTMTQLQQVRPQGYFYTHSQIRQGHTNKGQILGAAIGPGSNSQFFSVDAYRGDFKIGLLAQRVVNNDNFHLRTNAANLTPADDFGDYFRHRVDLNIGANFLYGPGPFYLSYKLLWTKAYNYGRFDYGDLTGINVTNYERNDLSNIQFQMGVRYVF